MALATARHALAQWLAGTASYLRGVRFLGGAVSARVDDEAGGWGAVSAHPHERQWAEMQALYADTLTAWRKNPLAKRAVDITADYVIGDGIQISSPFPPLQRYVAAFWHQRRNLMANRLETMCNELTLAGDLFPVLFTNPYDGMSYLRFVAKDRISQIETAGNDWETELAYSELPRAAGEPPVVWYGAANPAATARDPIMLHYSINRPLGALLGEGDLATLVPWLLRYSRMLEDRVRLNAAVRSFLWFVTVPSNRVQEKRAQYATPPAPGSVVVKDDGETWAVESPNLQAGDVAHDLEAVRRMVYAGSSFPPHWYGEPGSNRAEASAMQGPAERHLLRRQRYFVFILHDLLFHGYRRARQAQPQLPPLPTGDYHRLFTPAAPDVSRRDNAELAAAAQSLVQVWRGLVLDEAPRSRTLTEALLTQLFRFMGEPQAATTVSRIADEIFAGVAQEARG